MDRHSERTMSEKNNVQSKSKTSYIMLMFICVIFIVISAVTDQHENFIITIPAIILTAYGLVRQDKLALPPWFIVFF
ncbi:MAG: hypothetical protein MJZ38_01825, partial [archaeon]|nr:hypothetical protein [archaeon]